MAHLSTWMILALCLAAVGYAGRRLVYWVREGRLMQTSGHLSPSPSIFARLFWRFATPILSFLTVGPVKVIGREKLRKVNGRKIFVPNHTFQMDFNMVSTGVRQHFRYMTTTGELKGFRGVLGAWTGSIPVNTKVEGGGEAALNASIECLVEDRNSGFLIFPQGKLLSQDEIKREDFKTGAVRMAKSVFEETDGESVWLVPMALYYIRDARLASFTQRIAGFTRRAFGVQNYGAVVVIGEPINAKDLPADVHAATDLVYEKICVLVQEASSQVAGRLQPAP